jgi:multidrug efflux pump subunit AcrB
MGSITVIRLFAEHRVAANLAMIMMTLAGIWAIRVMPTQLDPPADFPVVFVEVTWPGASAEDLESLVTSPIEQALRSLHALNEITSRSEHGYARILVRFDHGADITLGLDQVKQQVAGVRNLPAGIEPPEIRRYVDLEPVAVLQVSGDGQRGRAGAAGARIRAGAAERVASKTWSYDGLPGGDRPAGQGRAPARTGPDPG